MHLTIKWWKHACMHFKTKLNNEIQCLVIVANQNSTQIQRERFVISCTFVDSYMHKQRLIAQEREFSFLCF